MKKLTSLQILMVLGLGLSSSAIFCWSDEAMDIQNMNEAVAAELDSAQTEAARLDVLTGLAELYQMQVDRIIVDESDLESSFNSIRNFINKKNTEIESLLQQNDVSEAEVARLAVELADAKSELENTIAKQRAKHKKSNRQEQSINDAFAKAGQNIKRLWNKNIGRPFNSAFGSSQPTKQQKSKKAAKKAARAEQAMDAEQPMLMDNADEAIAMMDNQMMDDEVVVQSTGKKSSSSSSKKQQPSKSQSQPKKKSKKS